MQNKKFSTTARLQELRLGISPGNGCVSVSCECCVSSGRGLCVGPIPRPESYRVCVSLVAIQVQQ